MDLNVLVTINAIVQLTRVAKLLAGLRARRGNISDMTSHGTGPHARAKERKKNTIDRMDSQEIAVAGTE